MERTRVTFASRFGTIAVLGGSVVGLGNIWRFPYLAGENGGAAFILVYIAICLMISVPIMLSELVIGRHSKSNALRAIKRLSKNRFWQSIGVLGIVTALVILPFYSVIAGWAIHFLVEAATGNLVAQTAETIKEQLDLFVASGWKPVIFAFIFLGATSAVVALGIKKGIELNNKILMPLMALILLGLAVNSLTLEGFRDGMRFLLAPDFAKLTPRSVLDALGQSFFSMSLGMGAMITFGSYIKKNENLFTVAGTVAATDTTIAILSGIAIFPAVFTFGINPTSGPDLVFITLPSIFARMTGGYIISILFFFLLFAAAITSSISLMEVVVAYVSEEFRIRRHRAVGMVSVLVAGLTALCAISQIPDSNIRVLGKNIFDLFNDGSSTLLMPLGALLTIIFSGWFMSREKYLGELSNKGTAGRRLVGIVRLLVRFLIPLTISLLMLSQLGVIG